MDWQNLTKQALASAISKDVAGFNQFRAENPDWNPENGTGIKAASFAAGADLRGVNFSGWQVRADLNNADLRDANLSATNFGSSNIIGVQINPDQMPDFLAALGVKVAVAVV